MTGASVLVSQRRVPVAARIAITPFSVPITSVSPRSTGAEAVAPRRIFQIWSPDL